MDLQLSSRRALVTGGTRGIGRAIVEGFAAEGAAVGFCAGSVDDVAAMEQPLKDRGVQVLGQALDVADGPRCWLELRALRSLASRYPDQALREQLRELVETIPSGHDLPAFRAATGLLNQSR